MSEIDSTGKRHRLNARTEQAEERSELATLSRRRILASSPLPRRKRPPTCSSWAPISGKFANSRAANFQENMMGEIGVGCLIGDDSIIRNLVSFVVYIVSLNRMSNWSA